MLKIKQFLKDSPIQMSSFRVDHEGGYTAPIFQDYVESCEMYLQFATD